METEIRESDLLDDTEQIIALIEQSSPVQAIHQAIASMPIVDAEKVEAIRKKILNGELKILGTEAERLICAEKIAQRIMEEHLLSNSNPSDAATND